MDNTVLIYDSDCRFCQRQAARLQRLSGNRIALESFRDPGVLERYPGLTREVCELAMQFVTPTRRSAGAQAAADILRLNPLLAWAGWLYYVPGIRSLADVAYRWVARNRFRFGGCASDSCQIHHD